jgi:Flp pilus assembly protein TadG
MWQFALRKRVELSARRRRGAVTLEFIIALPILVIVTLALVQYGVLLLVQQAVTHAATIGAREAAKGADVVATAASVSNVLSGTHGITISDTAGSGAKVLLESSDNLAIVTETEFGDPDLTCNPPAPALGANEVRVTVCLSLTSKPLLNVLAAYGLSFSGKRFEISALAKKESS